MKTANDRVYDSLLHIARHYLQWLCFLTDVMRLLDSLSKQPSGDRSSSQLTNVNKHVCCTKSIDDKQNS